MGNVIASRANKPNKQSNHSKVEINFNLFEISPENCCHFTANHSTLGSKGHLSRPASKPQMTR